MALSIHIIGSGFSSLAAACYLAKKGYQVTIFEKNEQLGGRASQLNVEGFSFDMGPTFYWMPDVFERFFGDFQKKVSDYYNLIRLDPAYSVVFNDEEAIPISANFNTILKTFESVEPQAAKKLENYMRQAESNYEIAIKDLVYQPGESIFELVTPKTIMKLPAFTSTIKRDAYKIVKHPYLRMILQFPSLFLGAKPSNTPSFYNFMNHADFKLGTWHPSGGMYMVVEAMVALAKELGVQFHVNSAVTKIEIENGYAKAIRVNDKLYKSDVVLSGADYAHSEQLLEAKFRKYTATYWKKKTFAPSALLFYVGFNKKVDNVQHHTLFFDTDFDAHSAEIYDTKKWPKDPLFYASFPSKTDKGIAPEGKEAAIFLIPLATGIKDSSEERERIFKIIINRLENYTKQKLANEICVKESFGINDFTSRYNAYGGNAYGLANTLMQTHILRPKLRSPKVSNLFFTGQLTVPGPGVPPSLISGKVVSDLIYKYYPNT